MTASDVMELRERVASLHRQLDERNEATKGWIQSDTQCRAYANKLEALIEGLAAALEGFRVDDCFCLAQCFDDGDHNPVCVKAIEALDEWRKK